MATITFNPDPPHQGKVLKICYNGGSLPATLSLDWDPAGVPTSVTCPAPGGCATITVPGNATSVIAHDPSGAAPDKASVVKP